MYYSVSSLFMSSFVLNELKWIEMEAGQKVEGMAWVGKRLIGIRQSRAVSAVNIKSL